MNKHYCGIVKCRENADMDIYAMGYPAFKVCTGYIMQDDKNKFKRFDRPEFTEIYLCKKHMKLFGILTYNWIMEMMNEVRN